jgi:hypothetical protein
MIKCENKMIEIPIERKIDPAGFIEYCIDFYGEDGIYDMGMTYEEVLIGLGLRMLNPSFKDMPFDGDSMDREHVRDAVREYRLGRG